MTKTRWLVPLTLVMLAGCFDVVPVTDPGVVVPGPLDPAGAVVFSLDVSHRTRSGAGIELRGSLRPGVDAQGRERRVSDGRLWIMGEPILPEDTGGVWRYRASIPGSPADSLEIRFPRVEGVDSFPSLWGYPVRRIGGDSLQLAPGEDLVLTLARARSPADSLATWHLTVGGTSGMLNISHRGVVPSTIRIDRRLLPAPAAEGWDVTLETRERRTETIPGTHHRLSAALESHLEWHVRALAP